MTSWREIILNEFVSRVSRLTLVADPDGLLSEEELALELRTRGFDIIEYEDAISFRYAYESQYRSQWDTGALTDLVVVLRTEEPDLDALPYDLLEAGRKLFFSLGRIVPNLSSPVVAALDRRYLQAAYEAHEARCPDRIGDNATKDFILREVFRIHTDRITSTPELLNTFLFLHYNDIHIPEILARRIITHLEKKHLFQDWPLMQLFTEKHHFFAFLQERWPAFVSKYHPEAEIGIVESIDTGYGLHYPGPVNLPFDHKDVRIYIDDLFCEGKLQPVTCRNHRALKETWVKFGIADETEAEYTERLTKRLQGLEKAIPQPDSPHSTWLTFAVNLAEMKALINGNKPSGFPISAQVRDTFLSLSLQVYGTFQTWLQARYQTLVNLPPIPPVIVNQIPRYLERMREDGTAEKVALIVIDGLSLAQWATIKTVLHEQDRDLAFREDAIFAWIPTLTSVSRQAIFSGTIPRLFPDHINTTAREPRAWSNYWEDSGIKKNHITYCRNLNDDDIARYLDNDFNPQTTEIAGFVINKVDDIMHGMTMGEEGMHTMIEQWCRKGHLHHMVTTLLENGFSVWITSDHGNVEGEGIGRPSEGATAEIKGERVRIYPSDALRREIAGLYPTSLVWKPQGLPETYYPLFAPAQAAYLPKGQKAVAHGGISIDEVIVPFVSITRTEEVRP